MLYEFALQPELIANQLIEQHFLFKESFGVGRGRLISEFPENWKGLVHENFDATKYKDPVKARKKIEVLLLSLLARCRTIRRRGASCGGKDWLECVKEAHANHRFHGIVTTNNTLKDNCAIPFKNLLEHDHWRVRTESHPLRRPKELANDVAPLLIMSEHIVFVDRFFNFEDRYIDVFKEHFKLIWGSNIFRETPVVELMTTLESRMNKNDDERTKKRVISQFFNDCSLSLARIILRGRQIKITVCCEKPNGQEFHNRYILTNIAGIELGHGLDAAHDQHRITRDRLSLTEYQDEYSLWEQYVSGQPLAFDVLEQTIVSGTLREG